MSSRSTQPRRATRFAVGVAASALSLFAVAGPANADYPPAPDDEPVIEEVASEVASAGGVAPTSVGSLPATGGSEPTQILWIASSALLAGVAISAVSLRRRSADNVTT